MKKFLKISAIGFVLIIVVAAIAGGGGKSKPKHATSKSDSPALVSSSSSSSSSQAPAPSAAPQVFRGTGSENIGTIKVPSDSTLVWSCPSCKGGYGGDNFQIFNSPTDDGTIDVNGLDQATGQTVIDAGTYHDVEINTEGSGWTLTITPGT